MSYLWITSGGERAFPPRVHWLVDFFESIAQVNNKQQHRPTNPVK